MAIMHYPTKVVLGDISVRDGLQHEQKTIPTQAKLWITEQLVLAGFNRLEVTNLGNPRAMPQFADADQLLQAIRSSKLIKDNLADLQITAVTIREKAAERAFDARQKGWGQGRIPKKPTGR